MTSTWFLGALIGLVSWAPQGGRVPGMGFDPSWALGIQEGAERGLGFGTDLVYTHGPLGFLDLVLLTDPLRAQLSAIYMLAAWVLLGVSVLYAARRSLPLPVAVVAALVVGFLADSPITVLAVLWPALALVDQRPLLVGALPVAGGLVAALEVLVKLNVGLLVFATVLIASAALDGPPRARVRRVATFLACFALGVVALWLLAGQSLGDLDDFVSHSREVISGYSTGQSLEVASDPWRYQLVAAALFALALGAALAGTRGAPPARRAGMVALVLVASFFAWKGAFVRHELLRSAWVATVPLAVLVAMPWRSRARAFAAAGIGAVALAFVPLTGLSPADTVRPVASLEGAWDSVRNSFDSGRREELLAQARAELVSFYGVDRRDRELLAGGDVHVFPHEISMVWAYELAWDPLPVFQSYNAYTPELDRLGAERLADPEGPARVLVHPPRAFDQRLGGAFFDALSKSQREQLEPANDVSIDDRYLAYDSPRTSLALLCNFRTLSADRVYAVLGRTGDRCGGARPIETALASDGEAVPVPAAPDRDDAIVVSASGLAPSSLESVGALLYRAPPRWVAFDEGPRFRFPPEHATGPLLLRAPRRADLPEPFRLAPDAETVAFSEDGGFLGSRGELRLEFYAVPIAPPHGSRGSRA